MKNLYALVCFAFLSFLQGFSQKGEVANGKWTESQIDAFIEKSELIPIQITGDKDNRINIVIVNQWTSRNEEPYNSPDMRGEFVKDIEESLVAALTYGDERAQTAYSHYKDFFNVYGLWMPDTPEWKKGIDLEAMDAIRDRLFLPWANEHRGWVTFLIMPNRENGGGGAARNLEKRVGNAVIAGNGIGKMLHEISHTCMSIGDEYTTAATGTSAFPTYSADLEYERDKIKWRKWIEPTTPLPTPYEAEYLDKIGAFEGNQYHLVDYYRSTAQGCIMGAGVFDNTEEMCPVCNQRVSMRVYDLVDIIKSSAPENKSIEINGSKKIRFAVDHIVPEPNTQVVRWFLNGKMIATGVDELEVEFGDIAEYELICSITDETPNIRPDPPFAQFPKVEVKWNVSNTAPTSQASPLLVNSGTVQGNKKSCLFTLVPGISGGMPPYIYQWSTGSTADTLKDVGVGIYDVVVTDSQYRTQKTRFSIYESGLGNTKSSKKSKKSKKNNSIIVVDADIKAAEVDRDNGSVVLSFSGGQPPYSVQWLNAEYEYGNNLIYEPGNADIQLPDFEIKKLFSASDNSYLDCKGGEGFVSWDVEVANSGFYPIDVVYGGIDMKGSDALISINGKTEDKTIHFNQTRPLYTGWDVATLKVYLKEGVNKVAIISNGQSIPNIDYLRVPSSVRSKSKVQRERINLAPGEHGYVVTDSNENTVQGTVTVPEVYPFEIGKIELENKDGAVAVVDPLSGYTYKWYSKDATGKKGETYESPLAIGTSFVPSAVGNYYVAAQNILSRAESRNRVGFAVGNLAEKRPIAIDPSELGYESIKMWFDASDIDGNGKEDNFVTPRGPVPNWKDRSTRRNSNELFMKYEPNQLSGKGVAAFDHVWVSFMQKEVKDYQTIIMVYKESSMSFPGTSLFRGANGLLGKSKNPVKSIFDKDNIDPKTKNGKVYLNGKQIDPFNTPNPMDFSILIVQLESKSDSGLSRTEGLWEGSIAEMIFIDRELQEWERKGVEEYLRRKWFSTVDVEF
ncbi:M64 family metallopeptidase [Arenibacter sp. ARW7G5Y1]|uniref:M64 family metallopeptidase n=1 Tax=Arenibacter sp. ARW7G5Y1 TaxID=2135619 RepID=UPI000D769BB8|nr:M64 family metallopeptidase [Arenibacter sp. ARW7G5Y1]PXX25424.1 SprB-like repeat protein [Arenibacter sp. ARW7G5Y1]